MAIESESTSFSSTRTPRSRIVPNSSTTPRKFPRQERSRRTVEQILDAAARIFHEQGYANASTNDIADEANVSIGSLYQYFPNKDALLLALGKRHIESTTTGLSELLAHLPPRPEFEQVLRAVVDFLVGQHELDELHLLVMHKAPRTLEINIALERARATLVDLTSGLLATRIEDRQRRALIARMIVATIDSSVHDVILRQTKGEARRAAIDLTIVTALSIIESDDTFR